MVAERSLASSLNSTLAAAMFSFLAKGTDFIESLCGSELLKGYELLLTSSFFSSAATLFIYFSTILSSAKFFGQSSTFYLSSTAVSLSSGQKKVSLPAFFLMMSLKQDEQQVSPFSGISRGMMSPYGPNKHLHSGH